MSLAVELWRALEAWDPKAQRWRIDKGLPGAGRFMPGPSGGPDGDASAKRPSLADVVRGTAANGPKRQRAGKGSMTVADAVRQAARMSDETGAPTRQPDAGGDSGGLSADPAAAKAAIRDAVQRMQPNAHDFVSLADLRADLGARFDRSAVDAALRELAREDGVRVVPVANSKSLKPRDRAAALRIGDDDNNVIQFTDEYRAPTPPAPEVPPAPVKPKRAAKALDASRLTSIASNLENADSMAAGRSALDGLTAAQLRQVAQRLNVVLASKDTKQRALDRILDSVVGWRLDSNAIFRAARN